MGTHGERSAADGTRDWLGSSAGSARASGWRIERDGGVVGFRQFLSDADGKLPPGAQLTSVDGRAPQEDGKNGPTEQILRRRMSALARAMRADGWTNALPGGRSAADNPDIPAGYTYFLQLVAHDIVASSHPVSLDGDPELNPGDLRRVPLRLETLYGGGPVMSPQLYDRHTRAVDARVFFRLGPMAHGAGAAPAALRDIARARLPDGDSELAHYQDPALCPVREPVLADPRNDDNGIVSQVATLFMLFHNAVARRLMACCRKAGAPVDTDAGLMIDVFETTRDIVTAVYRRILAQDALKRILHPQIHTIYTSATPPAIDPQAARSSRPSLEFGFAAFRFAHGMVRGRYTLRGDPGAAQNMIDSVMLQTSGVTNPTQIPPTATWIVDWSTLFECGAAPPDFSRRIGPGSSLNRAIGPLFGRIDAVGEVGLDYRDLVSAGLARTWTLPSLLAAILARAANAPALLGLLAASPLLADAAARASALTQWMEARGAPLTPDERAALATLVDDPPLPFFVRFEAASTLHGGGNEGRHLGVLGSLLVAEEMFATLRATDVTSAPFAAKTSAAIERILTSLAPLADPGDALLAPLLKDDIASMPALIGVVSTLYDGQVPGPSFGV